MSNSSRRGSADVGGRRGGTAARAVVLAALVVLSTVVSGGAVVATDQGTPVASNQPGTPGGLLVDGGQSAVDGESANGTSTGSGTTVENETATATASAAENDTTTANDTRTTTVNDTRTTRTPDGGAAGEVTTAAPVITGCTTITSPGVYEVESFAALRADLDPCIIVDASDVTLRGVGADSTVSGGGAGTAVEVSDPFVSNVTVRGLTVADWRRGIDLAYVDDVTVADVRVRGASEFGVVTVGTSGGTVRNVSIRDGRAIALAVDSATDLAIENLTVETYGGGNTVSGFYPGTAIVAGGTAFTARNVTVRDVDRGIGMFLGFTSEGRVVDLTARNVTETVDLDGKHPDLQFVDVDTGTATVSFTGSHVVLGPATDDPPGPRPGLRNATGYLNLTPTGTGAASVVVDYGDAVAEVHEPSVQAEQYDPGSDSWLQAGTVNRSGDAVTFAPTEPGVFGVFYERTPIDRCGTLDAPGVYEVASFDGPVDDGETCLSIAADDVTLRGTPGATVTGDGSGTGVGVDGTSPNRYENVTVRTLGVERYQVGVGATDVASVLVDGVRVADAVFGVVVTRTGDATVRETTVNDTSAFGVYVLSTTRATIRDVTVRRPAPIGVLVGPVSRLTVDGLTVEDADDGTPSGEPLTTGTALVLDTIGELDGRDVVVRNATRGVLLLGPAPGTIESVSTTDVDEAVNATGDHSRTTVRSLVTAGGEVTIVGPERVTVAPASADGTPADRSVRIAAVDVAGLAAGAGTTLVFPFDTGSVDAGNVSVYRFDAGAADWIAVDGRVDAAEGTIAARVAPPAGTPVTYAAFATAAETGPAPTACPRSADFGGSGTAAGTNVDGDPACEDVDGSGRLDFLDVIDALFLDFGRANGDPAARTAYDFDASGRVDFLDVVTLLFEL